MRRTVTRSARRSRGSRPAINEAWGCLARPRQAVVGRRADGYHLLQTVFQFTDLCDQLHFSVRGDGAVVRSNEVVGVAPDDDLVVRAARLLQQEAGCRQGVEIRVEKRIPMGGGLGGGSSDAATTLVVLNRL